jgi:hypothetical protein
MRDRLQADYDRLGFWRLLAAIFWRGVLFGVLLGAVANWVGIVSLPLAHGSAQIPVVIVYYLVVGFLLWLVVAGRWPRRAD